MDRVFLDANVLFSAGYQSTSLRMLWNLTDVVLLSSDYAVKEAEVNLSQCLSEALGDLKELLRKVSITALPQVVSLPPEVILVPKDAPILQAAIGAKATHLLTGDTKHFSHLFGLTIHGVLVLPPSQYLKSKT